MTKTYLIVTTRISDQVISEMTPRIDWSAGLAELDQRLAHRVKRRCADVAIDDAERGDRQALSEAPFEGLSSGRDCCCQGEAQPEAETSAEARQSGADPDVKNRGVPGRRGMKNP